MTCTFCKRERRDNQLRPIDSTGKVFECKNTTDCERAIEERQREVSNG